MKVPGQQTAENTKSVCLLPGQRRAENARVYICCQDSKVQKIVECVFVARTAKSRKY